MLFAQRSYERKESLMLDLLSLKKGQIPKSLIVSIYLVILVYEVIVFSVTCNKADIPCLLRMH